MKTMKFIALSLFVALGWAASTQSISAQDKQQFEEQKAIIKQRRELAKQTEKSVEANTWKEAKKAAKQMKKEGWKPMPGSPTLETQMNDYLLRRYMLNGNFPKYIVGEGRASAKLPDAARKHALANARVELAGSISYEVTALTEQGTSNNAYTQEEQETLDKMMQSSKSIIQQKMGRTEIIMEAYRVVGNSTEVMVRISADGSVSKAAILSMFKEDQKELRDKLEKSMNESEE